MAGKRTLGTPNGSVRAWEDASHLAIDTVTGASGCINIRATLVSATTALAAQGARSQA